MNKHQILCRFFICGQIYSMKHLSFLPTIGDELLFTDDILCIVDTIVHDFTTEIYQVNIGMKLTHRNTETMDMAEKRLQNKLKKSETK